jgi:hypothetical protein
LLCNSLQKCRHWIITDSGQHAYCGVPIASFIAAGLALRKSRLIFTFASFR